MEGRDRKDGMDQMKKNKYQFKIKFYKYGFRIDWLKVRKGCMGDLMLDVLFHLEFGYSENIATFSCKKRWHFSFDILSFNNRNGARIKWTH